MKRNKSQFNLGLILIIFGLLWLALAILFTSCEKKLKEEDYSLYTIEMTLINNMVITETYRLPNDATFSIGCSSGGAYWLEYNSDKANRYREVRGGVLYYRILNVEKCQSLF